MYTGRGPPRHVVVHASGRAGAHDGFAGRTTNSVNAAEARAVGRRGEGLPSGNCGRSTALHSVHNNLGNLLRYERRDVDGAENAYHVAIEADPGAALQPLLVGEQGVETGAGKAI